MNTRIILFLIILLVIGFVFNMPVENFSFEDGMLVFTRLNGSLIKKFKINSNMNISSNDVQNLFSTDNTIRLWVPPNHTVNVIYKLKNGGYSRTIEFPEGAHDLKNNFEGNEFIEHIESRSTYTVSPGTKSSGNKILVVNREGETLLTSDIDSNINWDLIYTDYGLDDYYVVYPWGRRLYYYYNYPYYRNYRNYRKYRKYRKFPGYKRPSLHRKRRLIVN